MQCEPHYRQFCTRYHPLSIFWRFFFFFLKETLETRVSYRSFQLPSTILLLSLLLSATLLLLLPRILSHNSLEPTPQLLDRFKLLANL